eukprot:TRINITY_DN446_c0_g1_i3.p1 TRINITY_DN446_c0_g1~~TRINITY_DN446_c0_g1_i3.p1  ORF type:complete len:120 (-),score=10.58 TRINITY_DN446_c0_g1_i3:44-403(-)
MDFPFWNPTNYNCKFHQPTRAVPSQRHVLYNLYPVQSRVLVVRPHAITHDTSQPSSTEEGVPFSTRGMANGSLAVGSQGHFQCDKSPQSQLFFALLIKSASLVKTASNRFIRIWVSLSC